MPMTDAEALRIAQLMRADDNKRMNDEDIRAICLAHGMLPHAVPDCILRYPNNGEEPLDKYLARMKAAGEIAHWFPYVPPEEDAALAPLIEAACGNAPTMKARAALLAAAGPELYATILTKFGCSDRTLAPGKKPVTDKTDDKKSDDRKRPDKSNPWSKAGWNMTQQSRLVVTLGFDKAAQIAASAGAKIGQTKPNAELG
jgi:hypothetical protein